jgi:hypothetical protein
MKRITHITTLAFSAVMLLTLTLASAMPALAQGDEKAAATEPAGIGILILLMGVLALVLVGGAYLSQGGTRTANGTAGSEEEEV